MVPASSAARLCLGKERACAVCVLGIQEWWCYRASVKVKAASLMRNRDCLWWSPDLYLVFSSHSWLQSSSSQFCPSLLHYENWFTYPNNQPSKGKFRLTKHNSWSSFALKKRFSKPNRGDKEINVMEPLGFLSSYSTIHVHLWRWSLWGGWFPSWHVSPLVNMLKDHSYVFNEVTDSQECCRQQLLEIDLPQGYSISQPLIRMLARGKVKKHN